MLVAMSQRSRRFVGRLDRGQEISSTLRALCKEHDVRCGEIRATGLLTSVEIAPYDREARGYGAPRRFRAFFELVSLHGTIATRAGETTLHLYATLARDNQDRGGGLDIVGGLLLQAEALHLEFILDSFDDLTLVQEFDPALGIYALARAEPRKFVREEVTARPAPPASLERPAVAPATRPAPAQSTRPAPLAREPLREPEVVRARPSKSTPKIPEGRPAFQIPEGRPAQVHARASEGPETAPPPAEERGEPTWEDAVRRSVQLSDDGETSLRLGDVLEHPSFGRCEVQRIDEESERIAVRLNNGRLVELGLEVLQLERLRTEGSRQHFRVHPSKR
jgi:predicted DNA-binding protein with PD1-like motif